MLVLPPPWSTDRVTDRLARGYRDMEADLSRPAPLSILFVTPGFRRDLPAMLEATRGHFALACEDALQAEEVSHIFLPDVVVLDPAVSGWRTLLRELCSWYGREHLTLVRLATRDTDSTEGCGKWGDFDCELSFPVASSEFEQLLWNICRIKSCGKKPDRKNDDEMIG